MKILKKIIFSVFLFLLFMAIFFSTYVAVTFWQDDVLNEMAEKVKEGMALDEVVKIMGPWRYRIEIDPEDTEKYDFLTTLAIENLPSHKIQEGEKYICLGYFLVAFRPARFRWYIAGTHVRVYLDSREKKVRHISTGFEIWD